MQFQMATKLEKKGKLKRGKEMKVPWLLNCFQLTKTNDGGYIKQIAKGRPRIRNICKKKGPLIFFDFFQVCAKLQGFFESIFDHVFVKDDLNSLKTVSSKSKGDEWALCTGCFCFGGARECGNAPIANNESSIVSFIVHKIGKIKIVHTIQGI